MVTTNVGECRCIHRGIGVAAWLAHVENVALGGDPNEEEKCINRDQELRRSQTRYEKAL